MPATRGLAARLLRRSTRTSGASDYRTADEYHADNPAAPIPAAGNPALIPAEPRGEKRASPSAAGGPDNPVAKKRKTAPNPAAAQSYSSFSVLLAAPPSGKQQQQMDPGRKRKMKGAAVYDLPTSDEDGDHDENDGDGNDDGGDDEGPKPPEPGAPGLKRISKGKARAGRAPLPEVDTQEDIRVPDPRLDRNAKTAPSPGNGEQSNVRKGRGCGREEADEAKPNVLLKKARKKTKKKGKKKKKKTEKKRGGNGQEE